MTESQNAPSTGREATRAAGDATRDVAGTAKEQAREMAGEAEHQARQATGQVKDRMQGEADSQTQRLSRNLRSWSDELSELSDGGRSDSPVPGMVRRIADGGRQAADWLDQRGVDGMVSEMTSFARRRPGAFLAGTAVAGFVIGRMAKAGRSAKQTPENEQAREQYEAQYEAQVPPQSRAEPLPDDEPVTAGRAPGDMGEPVAAPGQLREPPPPPRDYGTR